MPVGGKIFVVLSKTSRVRGYKVQVNDFFSPSFPLSPRFREDDGLSRACARIPIDPRSQAELCAQSGAIMSVPACHRQSLRGRRSALSPRARKSSISSPGG